MTNEFKVRETIRHMLKGGIRTYKYKNSKLRPYNQQPEGHKGSVFGFRTKEDMNMARGIVLTSEEALAENEDQLSHWTPNIFSYGAYTDQSRIYVEGHKEKNLKQINTFMIDFDQQPGKKGLTIGMILGRAYDVDMMPTMVLRTPRGYQAFFILEKPWFISSKNNYQSIEIAKRVSENIRKLFAEDENLSEVASIDPFFNHFGISRIPRTDNIVYFIPSFVFDMQKLIPWSVNIQHRVTFKKPKFKVYNNPNRFRQIDEKWFKILLQSNNVKGHRGEFLGRNNAIFTMSLACYSSGEDQESCLALMHNWNSNLKSPIRESEVDKIVDSAYSGEYRGASKEKILRLLSNWGSEGLSEKDLFLENRDLWYKFKKDRSERKNSHTHEWKVDVLTYLEKQGNTYRPEFMLTKQELVAQIKYKDKNIPKRSLDKVLKELVTEGKIFMKVKAGRGGGIILTTRKAIVQTIILVKQQVKEAYRESLTSIFPTAARVINSIETPLNNEKAQVITTQLNLWDTG